MILQGRTVLAPLDDGRVHEAEEGAAPAPRHRLVVARVRRVVAEAHEEGAPGRVAVVQLRQELVRVVRLELVGEAAVAVRRDVDLEVPVLALRPLGERLRERVGARDGLDLVVGDAVDGLPHEGVGLDREVAHLGELPADAVGCLFVGGAVCGWMDVGEACV